VDWETPVKERNFSTNALTDAREKAAWCLRKPVALVLGNEEPGLTPLVAACSRLVTIPGSGKIESLNVSVAGAVVMREPLGRPAG